MNFSKGFIPAALSRRSFGAGLLGSVAGATAAAVAPASSHPNDALSAFAARYRLAEAYIAEMAAAGITLTGYNRIDDSPRCEAPYFPLDAWVAIRQRYEPMVGRDPELPHLVSYELERRRRAGGLPDHHAGRASDTKTLIFSTAGAERIAR